MTTDCKSGRPVKPLMATRYNRHHEKDLDRMPYTPDITEFLDYQKNRITDSTYKGYDYALRMLTAELRGAGFTADPRTIGPKEVNYLRGLFAERGWKQSTERNYLRCLSSYCSYFDNRAIVRMKILYNKNDAREVDWLSGEQLHTLISEIKDPLVVCGAVLMSYGMLRRVDAIRIKMEDIDWVHKQIKIHGKGHRGGKIRYIPIIPIIETVLKRWIQKRTRWIDKYLERYTPLYPRAYHNIPDELFIWRDTADKIGAYRESGNSWDNNIKKPLQKVAAEKGFHVSNHTLRRTGARLAYKAGMPLTEIQLTLGHSTLAVTEMYLGLTCDDLLDSLGAATTKIMETYGDPLHYRSSTEPGE